MPPENQLGFGKVFSDHMFIMDYDEEQGWHDHRIVPFGSISLHPASTVLHYGAEVFEGLKAYRTEGRDGGEWLLVDFGTVIIHLFSRDAREYYHLERLLPPEGETDLAPMFEDWKNNTEAGDTEA